MAGLFIFVSYTVLWVGQCHILPHGGLGITYHFVTYCPMSGTTYHYLTYHPMNGTHISLTYRPMNGTHISLITLSYTVLWVGPFTFNCLTYCPMCGTTYHLSVSHTVLWVGPHITYLSYISFYERDHISLIFLTYRPMSGTTYHLSVLHTVLCVGSHILFFVSHTVLWVGCHCLTCFRGHISLIT